MAGRRPNLQQFSFVKKLFCTKRRIHEWIMKIWTRPALRSKKNPFSNAIIFEKKFWASYSSQDLDFFFLRQPAISWPSLGHQILRSEFQTFLKVFEKNDGKVILMSTNIIMGQLKIKDYEYDNGITIFWLCENLRTHFHLRLFDPWHVKEIQKLSSKSSSPGSTVD